MERVREETSTSAYTFVCYSTSALAAPRRVSGRFGSRWRLRRQELGLIIAVTVAAQLLGHSVFNHLLAAISPTIVSMALLLEVPGAALLAAVFLGQAPPVAVYARSGADLAGLALVVTARSRAQDSARGPDRLTA